MSNPSAEGHQTRARTRAGASATPSQSVEQESGPPIQPAPKGLKASKQTKSASKSNAIMMYNWNWDFRWFIG